MRLRTVALVVTIALVVALPDVSPAQTRTPPRVGFLCARPGPSSHTQAFERGLRELGYAPGKDILVEYRFMPAEGGNPFPAFAAELVRLKVEAIIVGSPLAIDPARQATARIPLIMAQSDDPVGTGVVGSLARPGGNITGLSSMAPELSVKQLELVRTVRPGLARVGVLWNRANRATEHQLRALEAAAAQFRVKVQSLPVRDEPKELDQAFSSMTKARAQALIVLPDMMFFDHLEQLTRLAAKRQLPTIYGEREFVDAGGLVSYGTNYDDLFRRAAGYVDKIVKGARPADLPIQQPTKFELVVNLKTAKALGLTIPPSVLIRADDVIQ